MKKGGGSANLNMMNQIATDMVVEKAMNDKLDQYEKGQKSGNQAQVSQRIDEDQENQDDLNCSVDSMSSGEEEIMRKYKEQMEAKMTFEDKRAENETLELTGGYIEKTEKEFFDLIKKKKDSIVCHFFHEDFIRCKLLDQHLAQTAYDHPETLFIKINVQTAPFIVTKLQIKVLPAIYFFKEGNTKDIIVGFEDFGNGDSFKRNDFLNRLSKYGAITLSQEENFKLKKKPKAKVLGESDDSDED